MWTTSASSIQISGWAETKTAPYQWKGETRYRQRTVRRYAARCDRCGWSVTGQFYYLDVAQPARQHSCE